MLWKRWNQPNRRFACTQMLLTAILVARFGNTSPQPRVRLLASTSTRNASDSKNSDLPHAFPQVWNPPLRVIGRNAL